MTPTMTQMRPGAGLRAATPRKMACLGAATRCMASNVPARSRGGAVTMRVATVEPQEEMASWAAPKRAQYVLGELLGRGTAGSVFVGTDAATGAQAAVKRLTKWRNGRDRTRLIREEVRCRLCFVTDGEARNRTPRRGGREQRTNESCPLPAPPLRRSR